jgi:hypothetical protein
MSRRCDPLLTFPEGTRPGCHGRTVEVYHGYAGPAITCEKHLSLFPRRVFDGHRPRMAAQAAERPVSESWPCAACGGDGDRVCVLCERRLCGQHVTATVHLGDVCRGGCPQ